MAISFTDMLCHAIGSPQERIFMFSYLSSVCHPVCSPMVTANQFHLISGLTVIKLQSKIFVLVLTKTANQNTVSY